MNRWLVAAGVLDGVAAQRLQGVVEAADVELALAGAGLGHQRVDGGGPVAAQRFGVEVGRRGRILLLQRFVEMLQQKAAVVGAEVGLFLQQVLERGPQLAALVVGGVLGGHRWRSIGWV